MDFSIIQLAIAISIVMVCFSIAAVKFIDFYRAAKYKRNTSGNTKKCACKRVRTNEGLTGRSIPVSREQFNTCRGIVSEEKEHRYCSYMEAMIVEILLNRISITQTKYNEAYNNLMENTNTKSKAKLTSLESKYNNAENRYIDAINSAAYWYLQGLISASVYKKHFLTMTLLAYNEIDAATYYAEIRDTVAQNVDDKEGKNND